MLERKIVEVKGKYITLSISDLDGMTFDEALAWLQETKIRCESKLEEDESCKIDVTYYGYDCGMEVTVNYYRLENDDEYNSRMESLKKKEDRQRERDLKELKRLQEKLNV